MIQAGVILGPIDRSAAAKPTPGGPITPVHDLNVPYEGTEEYETPTAEILFPPTPLQTPIQTPLPGTADNSLYNIPTGPSDYSTPGNDSSGNTEVKVGRPGPYMQPSSPWMNQRPPLDVNVAYVEGRDEADRGTNQPLTQAKAYIRAAKIDEIVDPGIKGGYHAEAMWRVVEVAHSCVETCSTFRLEMEDVVRELEDALIIENNASEYMKSIESLGGSNRYSIVIDSSSTTESTTIVNQTMSFPQPR